MPRQRVTESAREVLAAERRRVLEGASSVAEASTLAERVVDRLTRSGVFSLDRVINATGVVLHTNLGRALLSPLAQERLRAAAAGYTNLEMDIGQKERGSRCLVDLRRYGFPYEPTVPEVVASGVDIVSFSGDKLLGGPQAGIVVGGAKLVERLARNPLNRALRIDKFTVAALEATLYAYESGEALETIPTLRMLTESPAAIRRRARGLLRRLTAEVQSRLGAMLVDATSQVGGGALPTVELPTVALALGSAERRPEDLDDRLRAARPPVLGRLLDDRLLLDFRTVLPADVPALAAILASL